MVDSRLAFDILARDDGASAVFEKVARAADRTGDSMKKTSKISDDVAKASANLTKVRNAETSALDKVQVAEAKLAEVRGNSNSKTSQTLAAEKALAKARRDAAVAGNIAQKAAKELSQALDNEGKKAGKSFGGGLMKWLTGSGGLGDAGKAGGTVFGSGFLGVIKTPILGPAVVAAIAAGVVTVMPAVGAVAAGGLVAGFGAGLGALGIVFAAKSQAVKDAWKGTLAAMGADMKVISKPFESTLISMATFARRTFTNLTPDLLLAFKSLAPSLTEFGDELGRAIENFAPAIQPLNMAFQNVLKSLGPALQSAVSQTAGGLITLAQSVRANPEGLADMVKGLGGVTAALLGTLAALNQFNGQIKSLTGVSAVSGVMHTLAGSLITLTLPLMSTVAGLDFLGIKAKKANEEVKISADTAKLWTQGLSSTQVAAITASGAVGGLGAATARSAHETHAANVAAYLLATAFDRQSAATQKSIDLLNRRSSLLLALSGAEIDYQQAVDDATAAVEANGKTHDKNTQKGRDNQRALDTLTASAIAQRDAMLKANDGNVKAAQAAETGRAAFVRLAQQMGYTKPQAVAMSKSLIAIPNVTRTAKLQANKKDLEKKLADAQTALKNPNLTKTREAKLKAEISNAKAGIATINGMLGNLPGSKTVTITTRLVTERIARTVSGASGGHVPTEKRASGGPVRKGQPYIVGEKRAELFVPHVNGTILPKVPTLTAQRTRTSAATVSTGGVNVTINVNGAREPRVVADEVVKVLRKFVRVEGGGNVQQALGWNR